MAPHDLGRLEEAISSLDRAIALKPDYREALNNRAGLLYAMRPFGEAADSFAGLGSVARPAGGAR